MLFRSLTGYITVMPNKIRDGVEETIRVLSLLVAMISVISFAQRLFDVGMIAVAKDVIGYYREIANLVFAVPMELLGIKVPPALTDVWTLSFVGASAYVRTPKIEDSRFFRMYPWLTHRKYWKVWFLFLFGASGIGLFVLLGAVTPSTYVDEFHEEPLDLSKGAARNALYIFVGALVFFVLNALGPSA